MWLPRNVPHIWHAQGPLRAAALLETWANCLHSRGSASWGRLLHLTLGLPAGKTLHARTPDTCMLPSPTPALFSSAVPVHWMRDVRCFSSFAATPACLATQDNATDAPGVHQLFNEPDRGGPEHGSSAQLSSDRTLTSSAGPAATASAVQSPDLAASTAPRAHSFPTYDELALACTTPRLSRTDKTAIRQLSKTFCSSSRALQTALVHHIPATLFASWGHNFFEEFLLLRATPDLVKFLVSSEYSPNIEDVLLGYFLPHMRVRHAAALTSFQQQQPDTVDLRQPHKYYTFARALERRFIYHAGPTNSGKTYNAIQALMAAPAGVYCGPLRLLALEAYDVLNQAGVRCTLLTGEDFRELPGAQHISCTVEMASLNRRCDVAVVDEIQMIADPQRGAAWTRALLGLPANEIHLCGDDSAVGLVTKMCKDMGEPLEVRTYERKVPLQLEPHSLAGPQDIRRGDCLVAFGKMNIYRTKLAVELSTHHKVCVVYGALPPETRQAQARLFNDPASGYDVLVASDAIGMGLNLNIGRIIFTDLMKPAGKRRMAELSASQTKQIAGRAGRMSSDFPVGYVTAMNQWDLAKLRRVLHRPLPPLASAMLYPEPEQMELLASRMPGATFKQVLDKFAQEAQLDGLYKYPGQDSVALETATLLSEVPGLQISDALRFYQAPSAKGIAEYMRHFACTYAAGLTVHPPRFELSELHGIGDLYIQLNMLEIYHKVVVLWLWLSQRFGEARFPGRSAAEAHEQDIIAALNSVIQAATGSSMPSLGPAKSIKELRQHGSSRRKRKPTGGSHATTMRQQHKGKLAAPVNRALRPAEAVISKGAAPNAI